MSRKPSKVPPKWRKLFKLIPGYDCVGTAGRDQRFDVAAAERAVRFFHEVLKHVEGVKAGTPFILQPWQQAEIGAIFGWKRPDGTRRYREVFDYEARKNGKTCKAAGIVLYMLCCDGELGAQVYSAAADRDQAALIFRVAKGMVQQEPELEKLVKVYNSFKSIEYPSTAGIYKALSAESDTKHGLNPNAVIVDELHAQKTRDLVDVLNTATGARRQPLLIYITTADYMRESICNEKYDYAIKVRDGIIEDSSFLPVIFEASSTDDWTTVKTWRKANPNLGISVSEEYLRRECKRAQEIPGYENTFKRLHLNIRTEQDVRWLPMDAWDQCDSLSGSGPADDSFTTDYANHTCFAGLDLSSTTDITALVLFFPDDDNRVLPFFWIPGDNIERRELRDRVPYRQWVKEGFVEATEGNVVDYRSIRERVKWAADKFDLKQVGYDPWNARHLALQMQDEDGLPMIEFRQGFVSMNEPSKKLEALLTSHNLRHGGNPVLRWMASNAACKIDPAGNVKPDKGKSTERIDGIVALVMAIGCSMTGETEGPSVYDSAPEMCL